MTQPLLLAQTGASNQGASLYGDASVLDTKWKLGAGKIDPSAGIALPSAGLSGKKADFAQTLREKKSKAGDPDSLRDAKDTRESSARSEESRATARKTKRSDDKRKTEEAASDRSTDKADKSDRGNETKSASDTDKAKALEKSPSDATEADAKKDQAPGDQAVNAAATTADASAKADQIAAAAAQAAQTAERAAADNADQKRAAAVDQQSQQVDGAKSAAQVVGSTAQNLAAAASASKAKAEASSSAQTPGISAQAEGAGQPEGDGTPPNAGVAQAQANGKVPAAASEKIPGNSKAKVQTSSEAAPDTSAEPVKAASESGAQVHAAAAKGDREASDNQDQPEALPAQPKEAAPAQQLSVQAPRVETAPAVSQSVEIAKPVATAPTIDATARTPRVEAVQSAQTTPSSEMLRALAPAHSPSNINTAPQSAQANAAATNQDYQRLLGQQVERGIAQAIQQASAATEAMVAGTGAVVLRLNPANLGQLKVQIKFESGGGGVRARFEASSSRAKGILGDSIESLKTALEGRGLRVDEVVVAQSPRLPEPGVGGYTPDLAQNGQQGAGSAGAGFANQRDQAAPFSFGAPHASGDSRQSAAEAGNDIPIGGLGEQPVWLTGAAGWTVDASGNIRVDALV